MKDPFSLFIEDSVYYSSNQYYKLMFQTKKLFFKCLNENKPLNYFEQEASKIWDKVDHKYMEQRIEELENMISAKNTDGHEILNPDAKFEEIFKLEPERRFIEVERKYQKTMERYYKGRLKTLQNGYVDKQTYLKNLVNKYDKTQSVIPYYNKDGTIRSYHNIASYNSMLYNVNLTRSGWNRTIYDSKLLENDLAYLPAHPFACPLCMQWQGRIYSVSGKSKKYPPKDTAIKGGIGHPNCKHQWTIYWGIEDVQKEKYNNAEWEEQYEKKQKIQALQLERTKLKNDKSIFAELGNYEEVDKVNSKIKKINSVINELK